MSEINLVGLDGTEFAVAPGEVKSVAFVVQEGLGKLVKVTIARKVMELVDGNPKEVEKTDEVVVKNTSDDLANQMIRRMPGSPAIAFLDGTAVGPVRQALSVMLDKGWSERRIRAALDSCIAEALDTIPAATMQPGVPVQLPSFDPGGKMAALRKQIEKDSELPPFRR